METVKPLQNYSSKINFGEISLQEFNLLNGALNFLYITGDTTHRYGNEYNWHFSLPVNGEFTIKMFKCYGDLYIVPDNNYLQFFNSILF